MEDKENITKTIETPYFVFKQEQLEKNCKELKEICSKYLEKYEIAYSIKTNGFSKALEILSRNGINFEAASISEMNKIPILFKGLKIFNGPAKKELELDIAIKRKFLINIDSISEIDKIKKIIGEEHLDVCLRISIKDSKFGFSEKEILEIIKYAKINNLNIAGLHFHEGTQQNLNQYKDNLKEIEKTVKKLYDFGFKLKYINLGGGLPDKTQLKNLNIKLEDYFKEIKDNLSKFNSTIIIEPGRVIISDCFDLISKVIVLKKSFNKNYAILDAGINLLSKITLSQYKFSKLDNSDIANKNKTEYFLAGPLLFSNDILGKYYGSLKEGDLIKIENVGAYCYNLAWEISYKKPKTIIE
jgi:diaminopimelate decarboxylase